MFLFKDKRIAIILLAGCLLCPYKTRFLNKEIIFPMYGDFIITFHCMENFKSPLIPYTHILCWRNAYWRRLVLVAGQSPAGFLSLFAWGQRNRHFHKLYFFANFMWIKLLTSIRNWSVIIIRENHSFICASV